MVKQSQSWLGGSSQLERRSHRGLGCWLEGPALAAPDRVPCIGSFGAATRAPVGALWLLPEDVTVPG